MRTVLIATGFVTLLLGGRSSGQAPDAARAIIERAIQAHGGQERLAKHNAEKVKLRGTLFIRDQIIPFSADTTLQMPAQLKTVLEMTAAAQKHVLVQVVDGDRAGVTENGKAIKVDAAALSEMRSAVQLQRAARLVPLLTDRGCRMTVLEPIRVNERSAMGVRLSQRGCKDLLLYFDQELGLLVKSERQLEDGQGREVTEERFYGDYKDMGGYIRPTRVIAKRGGKKVMEAVLLEARTYEKIDSSELALP